MQRLVPVLGFLIFSFGWGCGWIGGPAAPAAAQPIPLVAPKPVPLPAIGDPVSESAPPQSSDTSRAGDDHFNPVSDRVQVGRLKPVDASEFGTLTEENGGLGKDMWAGSRPRLIKSLLAEIPVDAPSPVMRDLTRLLLLTAADLPDAVDPPDRSFGADAAGPEKAAPTLLGLRAGRLAAMGAGDDLRALAALVPAAVNDNELNQALAETRLLAEDLPQACAAAAKQIRERSEPYWLKLDTFCRLQQGAMAQVDLGLALLRDLPDEDGFTSLAHKLVADRKAMIEEIPALTPLNLALLNWAGQAPPAAAVEGAPPGVASALMHSGRSDANIRLVAAERAHLLGAIATERLARHYASVEFSAAERKAGPEKIESAPRRAALLYQITSAANRPGDIAAAAQAGLEFALSRNLATDRPGVRSGGWARLVGPILAKFEPSAELAPFAATLSRVFLAAGQFEAFVDWRYWLRTQDPASNTAASGLHDELWALALMADQGDANLDDNGFDRWLDRQKQSGGAVEGRAALVLLVSKSLGGDAADARLDRFQTVPALPGEKSASPVIMRRLVEAAAAKRRGEVVLLSLVALGSDGPASADAATLISVTGGLTAVGLADAGRRIALEALLARGY
jgi:hypothetical protein